MMKIHISFWTWLMWGAVLLCGYRQEIFLALVALAGHEAAHFFVTVSQGRKVQEIIVYPFGGVIQGTDPLAIFSPQEVWIAAAGPCWNFFCTALTWLILAKWPQVGENFRYWWQINLSMGLVNLLPFYPLDGGRILANILVGYRGYQKGVALASYITQSSMILGGLVGLFFRPGWQYSYLLIFLVVLFEAAAKERKAAPYVLVRYLLQKNSALERKKWLPAKIIAAQEECSLGELIVALHDESYYLICGLDEQGRKRFLGEKAFIDAVLEKGTRTKLKDVTEKGFND